MFRQALATENDISAAVARLLALCDGALIVVIALPPSSLHQIIANGVATVLIVLFLLASRKGFVVPGICGEVTLTIALRNLFLPVGLFVVQFAVLFS